MQKVKDILTSPVIAEQKKKDLVGRIAAEAGFSQVGSSEGEHASHSSRWTICCISRWEAQVGAELWNLAAAAWVEHPGRSGLR